MDYGAFLSTSASETSPKSDRPADDSGRLPLPRQSRRATSARRYPAHGRSSQFSRPELELKDTDACRGPALRATISISTPERLSLSLFDAVLKRRQRVEPFDRRFPGVAMIRERQRVQRNVKIRRRGCGGSKSAVDNGGRGQGPAAGTRRRKEAVRVSAQSFLRRL